MSPRRIAVAVSACVLAAVAGATEATPDERIDAAMVAKIRVEGLERSQAPAMFDTLTTAIGPRLTGSPAHKAAADWARERLASWGLPNARLEPWTFGRGWTLARFTLEMTAPRYMPLIGYAEGWSPSTAGDVTGTPIFVGGKSPEEIQQIGARLRGAIVLAQPLQTSFVRRDRPQPTDPAQAAAADAPAATEPIAAAIPPRPTTTDRQRVARILRDLGAAVVLRSSQGEHGTMFVLGRDQEDAAVPSVIVAAEHYNLIARMLARGMPVTLRVNVRGTYYDSDKNSYNVLAELAGTDARLRDEVVMLGAHLDSWHSATGATDNADGSAIVLEVMRILTAAGAKPRRTIRVALWGGEEQGLLGSRQWVARHLEGDANRDARDKFSVYFNIDPGTGPIYGFYLEKNEAVRPIFDAWLAPFRDLGARKNVTLGIGSTDHLSFIRAGVPGFNPVQSYADYDVRTHHTNVDTAERVKDEDLRQAAVVLASFVYHAATRDERIPRVTTR